MKFRFILSTFLLTFGVGASSFAQEEPVLIRLGNTTTAAEDQIWLMQARPDLAPNYGTAYVLETNPMASSARMPSLLSGQVDGVVSTGTSIVNAASKGAEIVAVAALSQEDDAVYSSPYIVMEDSGIETVADLQGKIIGVNAPTEAFALGARMALLDAGLDPDRDVLWAVIPPGALAESLREGKIDLASVSQPFYSQEVERGGIRTLFTHASATGFQDEFVVAFSPQFIERNSAAVEAFVNDIATVSEYYEANPVEARQAILDAGLSTMDPSIYLPMVTLKRKLDATPSREYFAALQAALIRVGFMDESDAIDTDALIHTFSD